MPKRYAAVSALALVAALIGLGLWWWVSRVDPAWAEAGDWLRANRDPQAPTFVIFPPDSAASIYASRLDLRGAVSLNIGWREHTDDELARFAAAFACQPQVWALWPEGDAQAARMRSALLVNHTEAERRTLDSFALIRFERLPSAQCASRGAVS